MKQVLKENAFEAWAAAIRFCDDIKNGKATLQYQKNFVSSLHNAVELIMKQMLLNANDHKVAEIKKIKNEDDAKLLLDYFKAKDLNLFFDKLPIDKLLKFSTIQFSNLISIHKKIFGCSFDSKKTFEKELKLLQRLRNDESHFLIRQGSFLSEDSFCDLHNFMIQFYKIMEKWEPPKKKEEQHLSDDENVETYEEKQHMPDKENFKFSILPYWGEPVGADSIYCFDRKPLHNFTYEAAVRNSSWAKKIAALLNENYLYGAPDFSPYSIAKDLIREIPELSSQFDEVLEMIYMLQSLGMIEVSEVLDDERGLICYEMKVFL